MRNIDEVINRINEKVQQIENYLEELESLFPITFEEYKRDFKIRAIFERYFEKIVEGIVDLAFLFIRHKKYKIPEDEGDAFDILFKDNIISKEIAEKLKSAKGMRNVIVHEYGEIDDALIFHSVSEDLNNDAKNFIKSIEDNLIK